MIGESAAARICRRLPGENHPMKTSLIAIAAAATIALSAASPAQAGSRSGAVAAGVIGGIAAGAIIGGAIANSPPAYAYPRTYYPVAGYEPYPVYARPAPYGCPGGYWARRPVRDQWGNVVGWSQPRYFCPRY
jgi:hypothetical protein